MYQTVQYSFFEAAEKGDVERMREFLEPGSIIVKKYINSRNYVSWNTFQILDDDINYLSLFIFKLEWTNSTNNKYKTWIQAHCSDAY